MFTLILNIIWLVFAGIELAIGYAVAGALMCVTIIGIPFGLQAFKLAGFALFPFGRAVVPNPASSAVASAFGNVIWLILAGWWLALGHMLLGIVLCLTIIGIPLGVACFKMVGMALWPFGRSVVDRATLGSLPTGSITVGPAPKA